MKMYFNIVLSFLLPISALSCTCGLVDNLQEKQRENYDDSNLIFLGRVVEEIDEDGFYTMEILEVLKGKYSDSIIVGKYHHSCSLVPRKKDNIWLVYTNFSRKNDVINISDCGLSRSFRFPYLLNRKAAVPPPLSDKEYDYEKSPSDWILEMEIKTTEYRKRALIVLREEIDQIRIGY